MNELEVIEQEILKLGIEKPPSRLRGDVLMAIENQRSADEHRRLVVNSANERTWLMKFERTVTFISPCLLAISLLVFAVVNRSNDKVFQGDQHSFNVTPSPTSKRFSVSELVAAQTTVSAKTVYLRYLATLQHLNSELFHGASQKVHQMDDDRTPVGCFRPHYGGSVLQLARLKSRRRETGTAA